METKESGQKGMSQHTLVMVLCCLNTARDFSGFMGYWRLGQLFNLGGDTAVPAITFSNDAWHAQRWWGEGRPCSWSL